MNKKIISLIFGLTWLLALLISSCQGRSREAVLPSPTSAAAFTPFPSMTPALEKQPGASSSEVASTVPPGCTAISPKPTPGPTEASLFPPLRADEWVKGAPDASVTFVEYGDFQ